MAQAEIKRVRYVCARCGSSNVTSDTVAQWNARKQEWVVIGHYDSSECLDCEQEEEIVQVELAPEPHA
jgi:hypothetical protein